jgi:hypothetical protein
MSLRRASLEFFGKSSAFDFDAPHLLAPARFIEEDAVEFETGDRQHALEFELRDFD